MSKLRVGVIFGGQSGEHEVSLSSARGIIDAINKDKYEIVPIGITRNGCWLVGAEAHQQLSEAVEMERPASLTGWLADPGPLDVIFPVLHGTFGEDGTIQGFLELAGIPYVGAGVTASAVAMDKIIAKDIWRAHGLPLVAHRAFLRKQWQTDPAAVIAECERALSYPLFVKPANLGSSVGIHKVHNRAELEAGLADAARYDRKLLVERGLEAREIEVSVLGNDEPTASTPGEIIPSREFYSYAAKYLDDRSELLIPAPLTVDQVRQAQYLAVEAFRALDCAGLVRCDFLLDKQTDRFYLNEINTMPGFTPISMYPKLWEADGLPYPALIDRLIELALERFEDKTQSTTMFDVSTAE